MANVPQRERAAAMAALYAQLPTIECRGHCWDSCGPIPLTSTERVNIRRTAQVDIPPHTTMPSKRGMCPALSMMNTCKVYAVRPLICRLWGLVDNLPCNFGCMPDGGRLSVAAGYEYLARSFEIDGQLELAARMRAPFATAEGARVATAAAMALYRQRVADYEDHRRAAERDGSALFIIGPGRVSSTPDRPDR